MLRDNIYIFIHLPFYFCVCGSVTLVLKVDDLGTVPSTVPMSSMSKPAPLDPAQFSLSRHGHPVQNGEIFFVSKSVWEEIVVFAPPGIPLSQIKSALKPDFDSEYTEFDGSPDD